MTRKKTIIFIIIAFILVCVAGVAWFCKGTSTQTLALNEFQNSNEQYEYRALPVASTISDVEKTFDITLNEADFTQGTTSTYIVNDFYNVNDAAVQTNLEFCDDTLQTVSFAIETTDDAIEEQFVSLSSELVALYGEPTETLNNTRELNAPFSGTMHSQGMIWVASNGDSETRLQILMMRGDEIEPNLSIIVGIVPQS